MLGISFSFFFFYKANTSDASQGFHESALGGDLCREQSGAGDAVPGQPGSAGPAAVVLTTGEAVAVPQHTADPRDTRPDSRPLREKNNK